MKEAVKRVSIVVVALIASACTQVRYAESGREAGPNGDSTVDAGLLDTTARTDALARDMKTLPVDGASSDTSALVDASTGGCFGKPACPCPPDRIECRGSPNTGVVCDCSDRRDYVLDRLLLPKDVATVGAYGDDLNGDGLPDNAIGALFLALAPSVVGNFDYQGKLDHAINSGDVLYLLRVATQNYSYDNAPVARVSHARAAAQSCCSDRGNAAVCAAQAAQACFSGMFSLKATSWLEMPARITAARFDSGPTDGVLIALPLSGAGAPVELVVDQARIRGTVGANGITGGTITGVIRQNEIAKKLIPALRDHFEGIVHDTSLPQSTRDALASLFDNNRDGVISIAEVASNSLISVLLSGDVDIDNDGTFEVSLGLSFSAVRAIAN